MELNVDQDTRSYILALDLGSSGPKVGIVDQDGRVLASASERTTTFFLPAGGVEEDAEEWWTTFVSAAKRAIKEANVPAERIVAVSCTSHWSVIVPVDENGKALMNAVHWMDTRGGPYNQAITRGFPSIEGYEIRKFMTWVNHVGMPPGHSGNDALGHMLFIKHERPDIYRKAYKFLEPVDYMNFRLTGRCVATQNSVLPMLLMDNRNLNSLDYDPWCIQMSGIDRAKLPDLLPIDGIVGKISQSTADELGLYPGTIVVTGTTDNSAAPIGSGAVADYDAVAMMGTSGFLTFHVPEKKSDLTHLISTIPSAIRDRYLFWSDLGNTGKVLDSFLGNLVYTKDEFEPGTITSDMYDRLNQVAEQVPAGSDGVIFLPWFTGSLSPQADQYMRGGFLNLSHRTTRAHMTRAVLEGVALNWKWLREPAEKLFGHKFEYWRFAGGGALSDVWAQIMADCVGLPIHQQEDPRNTNLLGAAFLAFDRLGIVPLSDIPKKIKTTRIFEPNEKNQAVYEKMFKQFLAAYKNLKPIYHALNEG